MKLPIAALDDEHASGMARRWLALFAEGVA
jgi:hypothetical protein